MSEDETEDPFAELGDDDDDGTDPFAELDADDDPPETFGGAEDGFGPPAEADESGANGGSADDHPDSGTGPETVDLGGGSTDGDDADPLADVEGAETEEVGLDVERDPHQDGTGATEDPFASLESGDPATDFGDAEEDLFTDVNGDGVDDESVWADLAGDAPQTAPESDLDLDLSEEADRTDLPEESGVETATEAVVPKRSYCEQCEYFSDPPEVACGYPGGEIVELVDTTQFRVRNCPIYARRESGEVAEVTGDTRTDGGEGS